MTDDKKYQTNFKSRFLKDVLFSLSWLNVYAIDPNTNMSVVLLYTEIR